MLCSGQFWCSVEPRHVPEEVRSYFHYTPSSGLCVQVKQGDGGCVPASNCTFSSAAECYSLCGGKKKSMGACASTTYGCCGDGVTVREGEGGCPGECHLGGMVSECTCALDLQRRQTQLPLARVVGEFTGD